MLKKLLVLLLFTNWSAISAQNKYDLPQLWNESKTFLEQPARWNGIDWLKLGVISASTFLISQSDQFFRDAILKDQSFTNSVPEQIGRFWGRGYANLLVAGAFGLHGIIEGNNTSKKLGFEIVQAAIYSGAVTQFLKLALGRARPYTNEGKSSFHPFYFFKDGYKSFPSGDVTLAFSLSTVLSKNINNDVLKILVYVPALITMASRMYRDMHWASDVFFGAVVGYAVSSWVVDLHDESKVANQTAVISPLTISIKL